MTNTKSLSMNEIAVAEHNKTLAERAAALVATVRNDAECSRLRWEGAVESAARDNDRAQAKRWKEQGDACGEAYDSAIEAIEAGDLSKAESELERANEMESSAGDNCDAHHALKAVRNAGLS